MTATMSEVDRHALNERIQKLKQRHDATKQELKRIEELCIAEKNMKQQKQEESKEFEDYYDDYEDSSYTTNTPTTSASAVSVIPNGLKLRRGKNKSFSSFEVREIERSNAILMNKIVSHNRKPSQYRMEPGYFTKVSNSQVNRRKKQQEIDRQNMILLKKIQTVKPFGLSMRK